MSDNFTQNILLHILHVTKQVKATADTKPGHIYWQHTAKDQTLGSGC